MQQSSSLADAILTGNAAQVRAFTDSGIDINERIKGDHGYPLLYAVHGGTGMLELLLCHGADVNIQDDNGKTALHIAAHFGNQPAAKLLLRHGANINIRDREGKTPLAEATMPTELQAFGLMLGLPLAVGKAETKEEKKRKTVAEMLIKHGAVI